MRFNVTFYSTVSGDRPIVEFLREIRSTHPILHDQVARSIKRFEQSETHGPPLTSLVDHARSICECELGEPTLRAYSSSVPVKRLS